MSEKNICLNCKHDTPHQGRVYFGNEPRAICEAPNCHCMDFKFEFLMCCCFKQKPRDPERDPALQKTVVAAQVCEFHLKEDGLEKLKNMLEDHLALLKSSKWDEFRTWIEQETVIYANFMIPKADLLAKMKEISTRHGK